MSFRNLPKNKIPLMRGLESDDDTSSSYEYSEEPKNEFYETSSSSMSTFLPLRNPVFPSAQPEISDVNSAFSQRALELLQTNQKYPNPTKRLLAIWGKLYS